MDDDNDPQIYTYVYIYIHDLNLSNGRGESSFVLAGIYIYILNRLPTNINQQGLWTLLQRVVFAENDCELPIFMITSAVNWLLSNIVYIFKHIYWYFKKLRLTITFSMYKYVYIMYICIYVCIS